VPGLSWSSLKVVAADGLVGERGIALRTPLLEDDEGRLLLPERLEAETVTPRQVLRRAEVDELLKEGVWVPVRRLRGKRGHLIVLQTKSFERTFWQVGIDRPLRWDDRHGPIDIAYVDRDTAKRWREHCAERFVKGAETRIGQHLARGSFDALARAQMILEQAMFAADPETLARRRMFILLGVVFTERDTERDALSWSRMAQVALFESPGLDRVELDRQVEDARRELKTRAERPPPHWVTQTPEQRLSPPALYP
jgi:hypothetical protein